jgi:hypothetical protein
MPMSVARAIWIPVVDQWVVLDGLAWLGGVPVYMKTEPPVYPTPLTVGGSWCSP